MAEPETTDPESETTEPEAETTEPEPIEDDPATSDDHDEDRSGDRDDAHLRDVDPGAGCTEIWEHLSETRDD
ncbi:hypothetical protein [Halorubellus litoreus]|uniref:Uncharacterized protein n=1 Tax=Halorubellus litoreus TaxID=755308 RepID=A0ABD5VGF4_9EURY